MSYLLQLPKEELPANIREPPYVIFAIQGKNVSGRLPSAIPLNMILHFTPKMKSWILPAPKELPKEIAQLALRFNLIGINIPAPVHPRALHAILKNMATEVGINRASMSTLVNPSLAMSIAIAKAWETFELPPSGSEMLRLHIHSTIMTGPAVTLTEMKEIWEAFDISSSIMVQTAANFGRSHINFGYSTTEFEAIINWVGMDESRRTIFCSALDKSSKKTETPAKPKTEPIQAVGDVAVSDTLKGTVYRPKNAQLLDKQRKRAASLERKNKERSDFDALQRRLTRIRSKSTLRSIADQDPSNDPPQAEGQPSAWKE